ITTPALLAMLDDTVCDKLANRMEDDTNIIFLKGIRKLYNSEAEPTRRKRSRDESLPEESIRRYQAAFKAKHGLPIPGRFVVEGKVLNNIRKGEAPRLSDCDTPMAEAGKRQKLELDIGSGRVGWQQSDSTRPPSQCEAAQFGLCLIRLCLSASLLGRMSPLEALLFMARVYEVGETSSLGNMRALEYAMRIEALRGNGDDEPFGIQVATRLSDTVAAHREVGRASAALASSNRQGQRQKGPSICRLYREGRCTWGDNCRYAHIRKRRPAEEDQESKGAKRQRSNSSAGTKTCYDAYVAEYFEAAGKAFDEEDAGKRQSFKNGGSGTLPGLEKPLGQERKFAGSLADTILQAAKRHGVTDIIEKTRGKPSDLQVAELSRRSEAAASECRKALAKVYGNSILRRSGNNSIYCELLDNIVRDLGEKDREFAALCKDGLPLGINKKIPYTDLYPRFTKKSQDEFEIPEVHENYASMNREEVRDKVEQLLADEEERGFIRRLTEQELRDPSRRFVRRACLPKRGSFDNGIRVVEDFKRNNVNLHAVVPNTASLPSAADLRQLVGALTQRHPPKDYRLLQLDLRSAYRTLGVHGEERKNVCFTQEFGDGSVVGYENLVLSFGLTCSAYWFVRYATCAQRCLEVVLRAFLGTDEAPGQFGSFMYVDDGFFCFLASIYAEAASIVLIFWIMLG
ncbi:hypothetical protein FOZ62_001221, partial [Perkinsus olseni]